jgi:hypothetical protein
MKKGSTYLFFAILITIMLSTIFLLTSCAPATDTDINPNSVSSSQPAGKEMVLVGQYDDVQVYKMIDNIAEVTCYVTINIQRYLESSIFCIK